MVAANGCSVLNAAATEIMVDSQSKYRDNRGDSPAANQYPHRPPRSVTVIRASLALSVAILSVASIASAAPPTEQDLAFYETEVLPVLREHCFKCHSHTAGKARGGLMLDSRASLLTGGDSGAAVVPRDADGSLLLQAVRYDSEEIQMPPTGKIADREIEVLVEWVRRGVPAASNAEQSSGAKTETAGEHWAFQPLRPPAVPNSNGAGSAAIDFLVERARSSAGVTAVALAEKRTVVRRLYLDLIGLPPTPQELAELIAPDGQITIERIVDTLLAMPEFGERWGRHWLDVARYADSNGCSIESNNTYDNAWRYRDYVISALHRDKPYDQFVVEQIAGDLLDGVSTTQQCEQLIATGFLLLGPKAFGTSGFEQMQLDVIDEQIDTVGKAMLGLSIGCARCHDHKFDPVSTKDYYALAGIFASTESVRRAKGWRQGKSWHRVELPVLDEAAAAALWKAHEQTKEAAENGTLKKQAEQKMAAAEAAMKALKSSNSREPAAISAAEEAIELAQREMKNAKNMAKVWPVISPVPTAMAVSDKNEPVNEAVRIRGEVKNKGDVVPRRVLPLLDAAGRRPFAIPSDQSGRLQLAYWLVDDQHGAGSLLARVAVNRIWGHLFARPLVASVDNFGLTGDVPSHPELLDHLASRFIESGWSVKSLIRDIVLTETYQLAAADDTANSALDPANLWLWRYQPKRIDVEVLHDSLLAMSGQLDRTHGGKTLQHLGLVTLGGDHLVLDAPSPYLRRSVYIPIYRDAIGLTPEVDSSMGMLGTFDFADPNLMAGARQQTVVPAQALFLMNSELVHRQASVIAAQLLEDDQLANALARIDRLFETAYGRAAREQEVNDLTRYLATFDSANAEPTAGLDARHAAWTSVCQAVFGSNEFLFQD